MSNDILASLIQRQTETITRQTAELVASRSSRNALRLVADGAIATATAQQAELGRLRAAVDQAISDLRGIVSMVDDPIVDEMARDAADRLGVALKAGTP